MPLTKGQIVQVQVSKNWSRNYLQVKFYFFKKNKTSDSSDSDFILSDEIYSSDSDVDIIHIDAEVAIKQGKRNNPENKIGIPRTTNMVHLVNLLKLLKIQKKLNNFLKKVVIKIS